MASDHHLYMLVHPIPESSLCCYNNHNSSQKAFHYFCSGSVFQFIPKVFSQGLSEVRAFCRTLQVLPTQCSLNWSLWRSLCAQGHCHIRPSLGLPACVGRSCHGTAYKYSIKIIFYAFKFVTTVWKRTTHAMIVRFPQTFGIVFYLHYVKNLCVIQQCSCDITVQGLFQPPFH